eukprot:6108939-Pyramimonas_sp.AAC.1
MRQRFLIVLQEVRGDELRLQRLIDDTPYSYDCYMSGFDVAAGGVAFLVPGHPQHLPVPAELKPTCVLLPIVPGRVAALHISSPAHEYTMCILSIHNHNLSALDVHVVE